MVFCLKFIYFCLDVQIIKMKWSITLLMLLSGLGGICQSEVNVSGLWTGTVGVPLSVDYIAEYSLTQTGRIIKGEAKLTKLNMSDSLKIKLSGVVAKRGKVSLRDYEIVYSTGFSCMSLTDLKYRNENGIETLDGVWKGTMALKTCPPGSGGRVSLEKLPKTNKENDRAIALDERKKEKEDNEYVIAKDDDAGKALMEGLRKRKYYSLIIGVDKYQDKEIIDLDFPVQDAKTLRSVVMDNYTFEKENAYFLENPTRTEIIEAFDKLSNEVGEKDNLLVFFAGHGIWDDQLEQGFWLPSDASKNSKAQWLSNSTIRDYIGGIKSKHTLLITDACFSGGIFKQRAVEFGNSKAILEMYKLNSRKAITSGTLKTVPDKSVFIRYLLKGLEENKKPFLSAEELFNNFKIAVINNSVNGQVPQYGAIGMVGDEGGNFIFLKRE